MSLEGNVEYALTRVQSQYGNHPTSLEWRRLESSHDLGQYLEAARGGLFGPWISALDRARETHDIERTLRGGWRRYVRSVAEWHPRRWQPWLAWLEWLPTLGLIARLEHAGPVPAWLIADPLVGPVAQRAPAERANAAKGTALAAFEPAIAGRMPTAQVWLRRWRTLRPPVDEVTERLLAEFFKAVREHAASLALEATDGVTLRDELARRLKTLFRASAGTLVATLCHLALMALDFERLRGGLVNRSLLASGK